ncbi:hypothetical protein GRX03_13530 [Halovenus sp. WSH3]|uniref:Uncharacterized protein n=1 Tax=Halovenus carboxidivorans TaxID=2692199 RepID=A0A6B0TB79_9EURY|nr:hypothetical protein [Halovenus carboxidivorans]MXR52622.1 hypothetical protein [Halovenus carboxidivorans]
MLTIDLDDFMFELKEGTVKHVGASTNSAAVKLYDIGETEVREFGDQLKITCSDDSGNEIELALDPADAREIARGVEQLSEEGSLSE